MASKVNVVGIVAWVLVVVLALGAGALGFLFQKQSARAASLQDALAQVVATAGVPDLAADAALPDVLQKVQGTIQGVQQELTTAKESLTAVQAEAASAKTELATTLSQKVQEQTAAAEAAAKDLAAKDEAIAAAKAETEKAAQDAKAAQEAADQQKAELEGTVAGLKAQMAEETARLQAELEAARQPPPVEEVAAVEGESVPEEISAEEAAAQAAKAEEDQARILGQSSMISLIRYAPEDQILYLRLLDGQELTYRDVPQDIYDQLVASPDKLDMTYRFKIQGAFKSLPPDSVVVRKYWKWHRRNKSPQGDVRVIDPPAAPAVEEEAVPEEAPAEAAVPEAAVVPAE